MNADTTSTDSSSVLPLTSREVRARAWSAVGTTKALVAVWAMSQPEADMEAMTAAALEQLDGIWPYWLGNPVVD